MAQYAEGDGVLSFDLRRCTADGDCPVLGHEIDRIARPPRGDHGRADLGRLAASSSTHQPALPLAGGITKVILKPMKTAVSMPDEVFEQAERCAKKLGISRSELVTRALRRFLEDEQASAIRASYDAAFGSDAGEDDARTLRRKATRHALAKVQW